MFKIKISSKPAFPIHYIVFLKCLSTYFHIICHFKIKRCKTRENYLASLVDKNSLIGLDLDEGISNVKRCQTCAMIHVNKTFPACSIAAVVLVCSHRFHRHLDLCGMFDRPLCHKIVGMYVLRRKGKSIRTVTWAYVFMSDSSTNLQV